MDDAKKLEELKKRLMLEYVLTVMFDDRERTKADLKQLEQHKPQPEPEVVQPEPRAPIKFISKPERFAALKAKAAKKIEEENVDRSGESEQGPGTST